MEIKKDYAAIITGGASGLGEATARALSKAGVKVALLDRNLAAAESIAKEINGIAIQCDVTKAKDAEDAVEIATAKHGIARILVNCAGVAPGKRIVSREGAPMPLQDFVDVININLIGTFNLMRLAASAMSALEKVNEDGERGVMINTASIAGFEGQIGQAAYSASKGAVASMTLPAARELSIFGIRVVSIAPGVFGTPMVKGMSSQVQESLESTVPFPKRLGRPPEFASLVLEIIRNSMLNGCTLRLDAAMRMNGK